MISRTGSSKTGRRLVDIPVSSREFLPPTEDAAELISPFRGEAKLIAEIANVQPEAVYQRTAELMVELGGADFDDAERALRQRLDGMELKLVFRRPRAALARRALGVATTELIDAGRIPEEALESVDIILRAGDPMMLLHRPGLRPTGSSRFANERTNGYYSTGWEASVSTDQSALVQPEETVDGVVLAEETSPAMAGVGQTGGDSNGCVRRGRAARFASRRRQPAAASVRGVAA